MRYFVGFLIAIGLIVLLFILIIRIFTGGGGKEAQKIDLTSYATTDAVVRLTIDGPVNANQDHRQIKITVGRDQTTIDVMQGYEGDTMLRRSFANNQNSYTDFLYALKVAGYTEGDTNPNKGDERGYCPTGQRFVYEALSSNEQVIRWWHTSCNQGNFKGKANVINQLFKTQIPDYSKLVQNTGLY